MILGVNVIILYNIIGDKMREKTGHKELLLKQNDLFTMTVTEEAKLCIKSANKTDIVYQKVTFKHLCP